jgi:hypothetical protein
MELALVGLEKMGLNMATCLKGELSRMHVSRTAKSIWRARHQESRIKISHRARREYGFFIGFLYALCGKKVFYEQSYQ